MENRRNISFSPPDISELEIDEVVDTLRSGWITTGPKTKLLERRIAAYIDTGSVDIDCNSKEAHSKYSQKVVCLNSATAAEELNLRILGICSGDEVIVPAYTYTATASAAIHCGATVRFVDIQRNGDINTHGPEVDYVELEQLITERTKAIVLVDLGGIICDYDRVFEIVNSKRHMYQPVPSDGTSLGDLNHNIQKGLGRVAVFADAAHSLGARRLVKYTGKGSVYLSDGVEYAWRNAGSIADFTDFSFHAVKNFTTAEGGASTWCLPDSVYEEGVTDSQIYKHYQLLSLHGQNKDALDKTKSGAWEYDIIGSWYKCNMTDISAAIGLRQLDRYTQLLERRADITEKYNKCCNSLGITHLVHKTDFMYSSNHLYLIRIPNITEEQRNQFILKMSELGIATNVHYKPLPMMTAYKETSEGIEKYPNSYDYYHNLVSLPLHTLLSDEDVEYVCDCLIRVHKEICFSEEPMV